MMRRFACFVSLLVALTACGPGDDNQDPNNEPFLPNNENNSTTNNETVATNNASNNAPINSGFGEACRGVECSAGFRCVQGACVPADFLVSCEVAEDLGVVEYGQPYSGSADTTPNVDAIKATCSNSGSMYSGAEHAIRFEVDAPGSATFQVTSTDTFPWLVEVRADCEDPGEVFEEENNIPQDNSDPGPLPRMTRCSTDGRLSFPVEPGEVYWLIVEPRETLDSGTFDWELELQERVCDLGRTCQDDSTVLECFGGVEENMFDCGTTCQDGACVGDTCAAAIEVTGSMSWSGDAQAFTNTLNFETEPSCSIDMSGGYATPGPDLVLSLPGLTAGQTVTVDASMMDDNDNAIFVLQECAVAPCLAAEDLGDVLVWDVPADGDYFVVIDKFTNSDHPFNYAIDIQ